MFLVGGCLMVDRGKDDSALHGIVVGHGNHGERA